ncbi:hypothetical protein [Sphingomonas fuzhouensis]|uniref:hypothetical protein n=1 Tax=Sphingomonas fuzhouensis TaxID=3106033 RepID=UPI002AFFB24A|nr:hypothetical protein [Sphingomonas sp. SGZ-02]
MPPLLPGGVVVPPVVPLPIEPLVVGSLPSVPLPVVVDEPVVSGNVDGVFTVLSGVVVRLRLLLRVVERVEVLGVVDIVSPGWPMVWPGICPGIVWPVVPVCPDIPPVVPPDTCAKPAAGITSAAAAITCM